MKNSLKDCVVVVTGGSAGLGRATALAFAKRGAHVAILARGEARLKEAEAELARYGGRTLALSVDVADGDAVERAADTIEAELGPIAVWVNNAMCTIFSPLEQIASAEFRRVTEVTYLGFVHGTMAALKRMRPRNAGAIVQVGSALAYRSIPLQSAYCGAKAGARGFTDSIRSELIHERSQIRLSMVHMPALNTPQFDWCLSRMPRRSQPVAPIFQPEVGAEAIVWAATHRRRELFVGLPAVQTVVANKLFPGLSDRLAARLAWDGQMTEEPQPAPSESNLFAPVAGSQGAHGRFDAVARTRSPVLWMSKNRGWLGVALLASVALGALVHAAPRMKALTR